MVAVRIFGSLAAKQSEFTRKRQRQTKAEPSYKPATGTSVIPVGGEILKTGLNIIYAVDDISAYPLKERKNVTLIKYISLFFFFGA